MKVARCLKDSSAFRLLGRGIGNHGFMAVLLGSLVLAACVWDDPRYPVYYRYRVDVKVDGLPVTIARVIKCTGTIVKYTTGAPTSTSGGTYVNPPVIGAKVPGDKAAVYTPVVGACPWASASQAEIDEEKDHVHRFLDRPFTEKHQRLKPDAKMPVLWVNDAETFDRMEYYVSETGLSGKQGHVEFIKAYPPVKVDKQAFKASEKLAETESPDLTPFIFPRDQNAARKLKLYKERGLRPGIPVVSVCYAAWRIPRSEWSKVSGLEEWVSTLPRDGSAYLISSELWPLFTKAIPFKGGHNTPSLWPIGYVPKDEREKFGRFVTYDTIHPVISTDKGRFVDLERTGSFGCNYDAMHPARSQSYWSNKNYEGHSPFGEKYAVDLEGEQLKGVFSQFAPVYVRQLDEFIVYSGLQVGGTSIDEPVVEGWKE